jgi:GntR family transcriptional regulator, vanillate catabolism transcriptional regulator
MGRAGIGLQPSDPANGSADHSSQVMRATIGLREMLLRGAFRPGRRISEIPLSAKLGVSRTPLRLAFERLEFEGLLKALPNNGFTANEFSVEDILDAIETRSILEGAAARLAAERLTDPSQLNPVRKINAIMEELCATDIETFSQYLDLNEMFHVAILDLSNNKILRRATEQIHKFPFASPGSRGILAASLAGAKETIPIAADQHRAILDAIEHREGARAESVAREHSRLTRRHVDRALADRNFLESIPGGRLIQFHNTPQH